MSDVSATRWVLQDMWRLKLRKGKHSRWVACAGTGEGNVVRNVMIACKQTGVVPIRGPRAAVMTMTITIITITIIITITMILTIITTITCKQTGAVPIRGPRAAAMTMTMTITTTITWSSPCPHNCSGQGLHLRPSQLQRWKGLQSSGLWEYCKSSRMCKLWWFWR